MFSTLKKVRARNTRTYKLKRRIVKNNNELSIDSYFINRFNKKDMPLFYEFLLSDLLIKNTSSIEETITYRNFLINTLGVSTEESARATIIIYFPLVYKSIIYENRLARL